MSSGKPSTPLSLYRNWPRKLLNHLPEAKKREHLFRRLGAENPATQPFRLPESLLNLGKITFIWPSMLQRAYAAFPVVMSLKRTWPNAQVMHLIPPGIESFARIACSGDTLVPVDLLGLSLDDTQAHALTSTLAGFAADAAFLLETSLTPWHLGLFAHASQKLRCHLGSEAPFPMANLHVSGLPGDPVFVVGQRLEPLLRGCGLMPQGLTWARLQPSKQTVEQALKALHTARINPGNLWAYLPASLSSTAGTSATATATHSAIELDTAQLLRRSEGSIEVFTLNLQEDHAPEPAPPRIDTSAQRPTVTVHSLSQLLGMTSWLKGVFGPPSPWLYLLSLTEIEVRTWLHATDSDLDLSAFNTRFRLMPTLAG